MQSRALRSASSLHTGKACRLSLATPSTLSSRTRRQTLARKRFVFDAQRQVYVDETNKFELGESGRSLAFKEPPVEEDSSDEKPTPQQTPAQTGDLQERQSPVSAIIDGIIRGMSQCVEKHESEAGVSAVKPVAKAESSPAQVQTVQPHVARSKQKATANKSPRERSPSGEQTANRDEKKRREKRKEEQRKKLRKGERGVRRRSGSRKRVWGRGSRSSSADERAGFGAVRSETDAKRSTQRRRSRKRSSGTSSHSSSSKSSKNRKSLKRKATKSRRSVEERRSKSKATRKKSSHSRRERSPSHKHSAAGVRSRSVSPIGTIIDNILQRLMPSPSHHREWGASLLKEEGVLTDSSDDDLVVTRDVMAARYSASEDSVDDDRSKTVKRRKARKRRELDTRRQKRQKDRDRGVGKRDNGDDDAPQRKERGKRRKRKAKRHPGDSASPADARTSDTYTLLTQDRTKRVTRALQENGLARKEKQEVMDALAKLEEAIRQADQQVTGFQQQEQQIKHSESENEARKTKDSKRKSKRGSSTPRGGAKAKRGVAFMNEDGSPFDRNARDCDVRERDFPINKYTKIKDKKAIQKKEKRERKKETKFQRKAGKKKDKKAQNVGANSKSEVAFKNDDGSPFDRKARDCDVSGRDFPVNKYTSKKDREKPETDAPGVSHEEKVQGKCDQSAYVLQALEPAQMQEPSASQAPTHSAGDVKLKADKPMRTQSPIKAFFVDLFGHLSPARRRKRKEQKHESKLATANAARTHSAPDREHLQVHQVRAGMEAERRGSAPVAGAVRDVTQTPGVREVARPGGEVRAISLRTEDGMAASPTSVPPAQTPVYDVYQVAQPSPFGLETLTEVPDENIREVETREEKPVPQQSPFGLATLAEVDEERDESRKSSAAESGKSRKDATKMTRRKSADAGKERKVGKKEKKRRKKEPVEDVKRLFREENKKKGKKEKKKRSKEKEGEKQSPREPTSPSVVVTSVDGVELLHGDSLEQPHVEQHVASAPSPRSPSSARASNTYTCTVVAEEQASSPKQPL